MASFLIRWAVTTIAVYCATLIMPATIHYDTTGALLGASLLLGIINALIRPVLLLLSLPFILVTLGFFILVINALLLLFVSSVIPSFHVDGFWGAFFGAIIISIISWIFSAFFRGSDGKIYPLTHHTSIKQAKGRTLN
ncbi:MAG: phage holin family protein [Chthoniobacterales bacterium]